MAKGGYKAVLGSLFWRYVLQYSFVVLAMFGCISVYFSSYYNRSFLEKFTDSNLGSLRQVRTMHESNLEQLINMANQVAYSPDMNPFRLVEQADKGYRLKKQLAMFDINNGFFNKIFLIYDNDSYIYTTTTSIQLEMFLSQGFLCQDVSAEELRGFLREKESPLVLPAQTISGISLNAGAGEYVTFIVPFGNFMGTNHGTLMVLVSTRSYDSYFSQEKEEARNSYIISGDQVVVSKTNIDVPYEVFAQKLSGAAYPLVERLSYMDRQYILLAVQGELNDMRYAYLIPAEVLTQRAKSEQLTFWGLMFVLSVLGITLVAVFSRRNYLPVRNIRSLMDVAGAGADDFAAIETGIRALVGRNADLRSRLDMGVAVYRGELVKNFIKCRYPQRENFVQEAAKLGLYVDKRFFAIMVAGLPGAADFSEHLPQLLGSLKEGYVTGGSYEIIAMEQLLFVLFSDDDLHIIHWIENAHALLRGQGGSVAASTAHSDFASAAVAYFEANAAYDCRFIQGNERAIFFSEISAIAQKSSKYPQISVTALKSAIREGDEAALSLALDELLGYFKTMHLSLFSFRCIYNDIIGMLVTECLPEDGFDAMKIYDVFTFSNCFSIDDLDNLLRSACRSLIGNKPARHIREDDGLMSDILWYMRENYDDFNITVSAMAERFGMSTVKFSLDFKEKMSMSPSEYLLMIRIDRAKELLMGTDISVKEICRLVGYVDVSGFIRMFKSKTAMTPNQYRNAMRG